jgi:hypothetical protein
MTPTTGWIRILRTAAATTGTCRLARWCSDVTYVINGIALASATSAVVVQGGGTRANGAPLVLGDINNLYDTAPGSASPQQRGACCIT